PTVTINGDGINATAVATIAGGVVTGVNLTNSPTQCYLAAPPVSISGGGGSGATADAVLGSDTCIYSVTGGKCNSSGWKGNTLAVSTSTGGGSGFIASMSFANNGVVDDSKTQ